MSIPTGRALIEALEAAGIIAPNCARRVVIDASVGSPVIVHVEQIGDGRLLNVVRGLEGVEVRTSPQ